MATCSLDESSGHTNGGGKTVQKRVEAECNKKKNSHDGGKTLKGWCHMESGSFVIPG